MTLLEIMLVLALMGGLSAVLLSGGLLKSQEARMRESAIEVLATLRSAYNMTAMSGTHHRVVFNLEEQTYHIEMCTGKQTLKRGDEEEVVDKEALAELMERPVTSEMDREIFEAASPEAAAEAAAALEGMRVGTARCQPATKTSAGTPSKNGNMHKLDTERDIRIQRVHVQHLTKPVEDKIVSINFFPSGSSEKAIVELADDEDNEFSILVHGMTSRVELIPAIEDPDDHMLRNGVGEEIDER